MQSVLRLQRGQGMAKMRHDVDPKNQRTSFRTNREAYSTSLASTFEENSPCRPRCLLCRRIRSFNGGTDCCKSRHLQAHFVRPLRSEEHTSELQSLMRISYAVFCLKKKKHNRRI